MEKQENYTTGENRMSETWAIAELMGHLTLSGRITKPGDNGGLWQIDIPDGDSFHTEFFGSQSVYRIRIVSEQIARAYVSRSEIIEYNAPIITQAEHQAAMDRAWEVVSDLRDTVSKLQRAALPSGNSDGLADEGDYDEDDDEDDDLDPGF